MSSLYEVKHLTIAFPENGQWDTVVKGISFSMEQGQILGVVGESGSGKSMTALATMGLLKKDAKIMDGQILFEGQDILSLSKDERSKLQGNTMSMIFQEPMTSLNPVMKIGKQVGESLLLHTDMNKEDIKAAVLEALSDVGLRDVEKIYNQYPHELSGGMRQRVMIAQAMICSPKLLIADEPTTALDVVVQSQILKLLLKLHQKLNISILFISHDLNVIKEICTDVLVMYKGEIVEQGKVRDVLEHPKHDYTKTLVAAIPDNTPMEKEKTTILELKNLDVFYQEKTSGLFGKKYKRQVVKNLNLDVYEGELMGIVGESGCGKSTLAKTIVGLNKDYRGQMVMSEDVHPQMVFQDPFGSLNPSRTIGWILTEPLRVCGIKDKKEQKRLVCDMLKRIGLDETYYDRYANELSGGQRQRISIGGALLMNSKLLVADEPVSALDVTVQSQILNLLLDIHKERNLTILFISHDLNIVRHICHRVAVIYLGEIVEMADVDEIYERPMHPYTQMLFESVVSDDTKAKMQQDAKMTKDVEDIADEAVAGAMSAGCAFYPRCKYACDRCKLENPMLSAVDDKHWVKCFRCQ